MKYKTITNKRLQTCATCIFSATHNSSCLECRRHAPAAPIAEGQTQFPLMGKEDFCGDWEFDGKEVEQ